MADTSRQVIITPEDLGEKDVFVINDINLVVPPSQINIQAEGLTYNWRTLRSKSATKIPTGNGQVHIHCSIVFPQNQLLALHRLLVQFRHSPFCYIDNRYIRESLATEWPYHQNMAFTMTGISLTPFPGSSDSWIVELDLQWFNYFPYTYNWLYREDWQTNWLTNNDPNSESRYLSYTIGWKLNPDTYQRIHSPFTIFPSAPLGDDDFEPNALHDQYSVTLGKYESKVNKTITEMEIAHSGIEFDLLPLPDNMKPARLVAQPRHSRIYVRYINLLQRDALMKNFGIDVEQDLMAHYGVPNIQGIDERVVNHTRAHALGPFFGIGNAEVGTKVVGLHTLEVPRALRNKWISDMLDFNHGVRFTFNSYKELKFPANWQDKLDAIKSKVRADFSGQVGRVDYDTAIATNNEPVDDSKKWYFTVPVLGINPATGNPWPQTSPFGDRTHPIHKTTKHHNGLDIDGDTDTPVMVPEDGVVTRVVPEFADDGTPNKSGGNRVFVKTNDGHTWGFMHLHSFTNKAVPGTKVYAGDVIGGVGTTGWYASSKQNDKTRTFNGVKYQPASTGSHLHLSLWAPNTVTGRDNGIDPTPRLIEIVNARNSTTPDSYVDDFGPEPAEADSVNPEELGESEDPYWIDPEEQMKEFATSDPDSPEPVGDQLFPTSDVSEPDPDALDELQALVAHLDGEGWKYYDKDTSLLNVWYKTQTISVAHSRFEGELGDEFVQQGVVLTNVAGALTHIVANLPLLSSEYPTHQHLGSIEPQYSFEFSILDDQSNLEGISQGGQALQGMRSVLQKNARRFRPVPDAWAVSTDTFITRIFGSYEENDYLVYTDGDGIVDVDLKKRTLIASSSAGTIEGQPGLSALRFNMEETNPYDTEVLTSTVPQLEEKEKAREKILSALYKLDFVDKYERILLPLFIGQIQGVDSWNVHSEDYGKFYLNTYDNFGSGGVADDGSFALALLRGEEAFVVNDFYGPGTGKFVLVRKDAVGPASALTHLAGDTPVKEVVVAPFIPDSVEDSSIAPLFQPIEFVAANAAAGLGFLASQQHSIVQAGSEALLGEGNTIAGFSADEAAQALAEGTANDVFYVMPLEDTGLDDAFVPTSAKNLNPGESFEQGSTKLIGRKDYYDISSILDEHPDLIDVPVQDIMDHHKALLVLMRTANRMMAEESAGGLPNSKIRQELYTLPIVNRMWASWQVYFEEFVYEGTPGITADLTPNWLYTGAGGPYRRMALYENSTWPGPAGIDTWGNVPEDREEQDNLKAIAHEYTGWLGAPTGALQSIDNKIWGAIKIGLSGFFSGENWEVNSPLRAAHSEAIDRLVNRYMRNFPIQVSFPVRLAAAYENSFGNLFGNFSDEKNKVIPLASMQEALHANAFSCGNVTARNIDGNPYFQVERDDPNTFYRQPIGEGTSEGNGELRRMKRGGILGLSGKLGNEFGSLLQSAAAQFGLDINQPYEVLLTSILDRWKRLTGYDFEELLYPTQEIGKPLGSAFTYPTDTSTEDVKLRYLKGLFAQLADDLLLKPNVLRVLGLEHLALNNHGNKIKGTECYPDLDLPTHPYYGDTYQVYPDFYMWNIYEDGGALNVENQQRIYEQLDGIVKRCYESMKSMREGHEYQDSDDKILLEPELDDPIILKTSMNPEGTDAQQDGTGPASSPFAETSTSKIGRDNWADAVKEKGGNDVALYSTKPGDWLQGVRLSNTEGDYGAGAGIHYPARAAPQLYEKLKQDVAQVEHMFGDKAGYSNSHLDKKNTPDIVSKTKDTNLEAPIEYTHRFDENFLKKLARDSSKDLLSQKITLRRAFPTFKLFFIEEDETESRYLSFDDFHSYNAVKSFTVVQSRKIPADHAIITLQNVAGTLDGTRRNTIADLDYLDDTAEKKLDAGVMDGNAHGGDRITAGTAQEQPFGAVILRPGLNIQLRAGYANDPDNLHVMLSGRVVDVTWNKTGDLAEIMVQSFGTELTQIVKGTARNDSEKTYKTTHELLGTMMLEPEVVHFGRWEFGQLFQIGEAKDYRLDFTEYSKEGFMGKFAATDSLTRSLVNHPWAVFGVAAGVTLAQFLPWGRVFGGSTKAIGLLGRAGITAPLGKAGFTKVFSSGVTKTSLRASQEALEGALRVAQKSAKTPEFEAQIARRWAWYIAESEAGFKSVADAAGAAAKMERFLLGASVKANWLARPELAAEGGLSILKSVGLKPASRIAYKAVDIPFKTIVLAGGAGIIADMVIRPGLELIYDATVGRIKRFFARTQAHLFLTPQDDNLFPPHPKDYMTFNNSKGLANSLVDTLAGASAGATNLAGDYFGLEGKFTKQDAINQLTNKVDRKAIDAIDKFVPGFSPSWQEYVEAGSTVLSRALTGSGEGGRFVGRLLDPEKFMSKKVDPKACLYKPVHSTIWDMFHEMSLRHPGWIYGPRPYGTALRYTMFFGTPSQRYWSKGASNLFIDRMNRLYRHIHRNSTVGGEIVGGSDTDITRLRASYINLYGSDAYDALEDEVNESVESLWPLDRTIDTGPSYGLGETGSLANEIGQIKNGRLRSAMMAEAMREYLRGLEIRFVPFRNYHMLTSDKDIIWNGLMNSENAISNAVDVTYWTDAASKGGEPQGNIETTVIKAHSSIPERLLRIAPIRYENCYTYEMAMRYGVGELLHRLRDMYRGEITLLGNPRLRPWDICILHDTYNDMVGPVEIEQVVHQFSHETGFITEIKPSAVVFANETAGWPMIQAMKMFALAVKDIEDSYTGVRAEDPDDPNNTGTGFIGNLSSLVNMWGAGGDFDSLMQEKYRGIFGVDGADIEDVFGKEQPNLESWDGYIKDLESNLKSGLFYGGAGMTAFGLSQVATGSFVGGGALIGLLAGVPNGVENAINPLQKFFSKMTPAHLGAGGLIAAVGVAVGTGAVVTGGAAMLVSQQVSFPSAMWLIGGPILFAQCLRNEAIVIVPVMKSGHPVVSGFAYNDASLIWHDIGGKLERYADAAIGGLTDMYSLYQKYGTSVWSRLNDPKLADMTGGGL